MFEQQRKHAFGLIVLATLVFAAHSARSDVIELQGGGRLSGSIVEATDNIVVIRRSGGGVQQITRRMIAQIRVSLQDGGEVAGELVRWANGIHDIRTEDGLVRIRAGRILDVDQEDAGTTEAEVDAAASSGAQTPPRRQSYVPPPVYILNNGATIAGRAIRYSDPLLTIRRATGGQQTLRISDLREVVIRSPDGDAISGEFIDWSEGAFELRVDDRLVRVVEGAIVNEATGDSEIGGPLEELPKVADQATQARAVDDDKIVMSVSAEPANERDQVAIFTLKLSRLAPRSIAVIYSTLEGTADQNDFESKSGVITIKAGTDVAEIKIPLLDDTIKEDDESFRLFLSGDPKLVEMPSNRVAAIIRDDD